MSESQQEAQEKRKALLAKFKKLLPKDRQARFASSPDFNDENWIPCVAQFLWDQYMDACGRVERASDTKELKVWVSWAQSLISQIRQLKQLQLQVPESAGDADFEVAPFEQVDGITRCNEPVADED